MPRVAVVLLYKPPGGEGEFRIATTTALEAVRVVGEAVLAEAREAVTLWEDVDPCVAQVQRAEADRLERILAILIPGEPPPPATRGPRLVQLPKPKGPKRPA